MEYTIGRPPAAVRRFPSQKATDIPLPRGPDLVLCKQQFGKTFLELWRAASFSTARRSFLLAFFRMVRPYAPSTFLARIISGPHALATALLSTPQAKHVSHFSSKTP